MEERQAEERKREEVTHFPREARGRLTGGDT